MQDCDIGDSELVPFTAHLAAQPVPEAHDVRTEIDREVVRLELAAMALQIGILSEQRQLSLSSWQEGTS
jgi:S-adenosylhomocysteine hydrolase